MPAPYADLQRYRLPGARFPLRFELNGEQWALRTFWVEGGGHWRCYLEGPKIWNVCSGSSRECIECTLRESGVPVPARTFVGTAFRQLVSLGLAERVPDRRR